MTRKQIMEEITTIFRNVFDDDEIKLEDKTTAEDIEDWDSLMHITLITAIEDHFNVKFKLKEVIGLQDVGATVDLVEAKLNE